MSEETRKELSEEELQNVSGGGCGKKDPDPKPTEAPTQEPSTSPAPTFVPPTEEPEFE
ncbi:MAG: bacteriocin [Parasporobacterium sp.]|nr:bacteriocin [Parasporobacterium sp.]